ncbi:MAG: hypothetical protein AAB725_01390 [Patescibacteria group bacterium]
MSVRREFFAVWAYALLFAVSLMAKETAPKPYWTCYEYYHETEEDWAIGGGLNWVYIYADDGLNFYAPAANLVFKRGFNQLVLMGAWRPMGAGEDTLGKRAESVIGAEFTNWILDEYYSVPIGLSLGVNGAWEFSRRNEKFFERALGLYIGPKLKYGLGDLTRVIGLNFQLLNLNLRGRKEIWWRVGFGFTFGFQYFLK